MSPLKLCPFTELATGYTLGLIHSTYEQVENPPTCSITWR